MRRLAIHFDGGAPSAGTVLDNAFVTAGVIALNLGVVKIFGVRAKPEIGATVIQAVQILVIYQLSLFSVENFTVKPDLLVAAPLATNNIKRISPVPYRPAVPRNPIEVRNVNEDLYRPICKKAHNSGVVRQAHADALAFGRSALSLPRVKISYWACLGSGMPLSFHSETDGG